MNKGLQIERDSFAIINAGADLGRFSEEPTRVAKDS